MPAERKTKTKARSRIRRVLLVTRLPELRERIKKSAPARHPFSVIHIANLQAARAYLAKQHVDVVLIEPTLPDGNGLDLAAELKRRGSTTASVVLSNPQDFATAQAALRAGADDLIVTNQELETLGSRIEDALQRKRREQAHVERVERLHKLCRKLNQARHDVSRRVDVLCSDLVNAYQELATQVNEPVPAEAAAKTPEGYGDLVKHELDLENVLRVTLEHLLAKLGPSNAAIFLPATMDEYSLGGYVNYDCAPEASEILLDHLADTLAPRVAEQMDLVHLTDAEDVRDWGADDSGSLDGRVVIAVPCMSGDECLAVLVMFRDEEQAYDQAGLDLCSDLGPLLGGALDRIIKVHHRSIFKPDGPDLSNPFDGTDLGYDGEDLPF